MASAVTSTVAWTPLAPRVRFTSAVRPTLTITSSIVAAAKPDDSATTVYVPGGRRTTVYKPSPLLVALRSRPVCLLVTLTVAFGTAAALLSVTTPTIWPLLACDWAMLTMLIVRTKRATYESLINFDMTGNSLHIELTVEGTIRAFVPAQIVTLRFERQLN